MFTESKSYFGIIGHGWQYRLYLGFGIWWFRRIEDHTVSPVCVERRITHGFDFGRKIDGSGQARVIGWTRGLLHFNEAES